MDGTKGGIDNCVHRPPDHRRGRVYDVTVDTCEEGIELGDDSDSTNDEWCSGKCEWYKIDEQAARFKNMRIPLGGESG